MRTLVARLILAGLIGYIVGSLIWHIILWAIS